jgi:hypothetical protein
LTIQTDAQTARHCVLVELVGATSVFAVVHRAELLRPRGSASVQRELRSALATLPADPGRLDRVMSIVEKAIFEDQPAPTVALLPPLGN